MCCGFLKNWVCIMRSKVFGFLGMMIIVCGLWGLFLWRDCLCEFLSISSTKELCLFVLHCGRLCLVLLILLLAFLKEWLRWFSCCFKFRNGQRVAVKNLPLCHEWPFLLLWLPLLNLKIWNIAAVGKILWAITQKSDSLWIKWIDHRYMKGVHWRNYKCSQSHSWYWRQIWKIRDVLLPGYHQDQWSLAKNGRYTISSAYEWLKGSSPRVKWGKWVWHPASYPKHSFIAWLTMKNRLKTGDRLQKQGIIASSMCSVCTSSTESAAHLFFQCSWSSECLRKWKEWVGIKYQTNSFFALMKKIVHTRSFSKIRKAVCLLSLNALVYSLWLHRNKVIKGTVWANPLEYVQSVMRTVIYSARLKIGLLDIKDSSIDRTWLSCL